MTAGMVRVDVSDEMPLTIQPVRLLTSVVDCPECVWNDFGATGLDRDFVREWSSAIHAAGAEAVRPHLITAWRKRGYLAELVCHHTCAKLGAPSVPVEVLHAVAQEAVDQVDGGELLARADLEGEYAKWGER